MKIAKGIAVNLVATMVVLGHYAQAQTERMTTASDVNMTVSSLGLIGNSFRGSYNSEGFSSCQYPAKSGVEHLFEGGLWVGAKVGGSPYVTSAAIDAASGYSPGACNFEFTTPANQPLREISSLIRNPGYNPLAISHQDFISDFTDKNLKVPGTNILIDRDCGGRNPPDAQHRPLGLDVHFETYNWNYSYANFFVILNYTIKNTGTDTLKDVGIGYWSDGVVRNVRKTPPGGTPFYNKSGNGYIDSLKLSYEFDATGDPGFTESYFGLRFLGADYFYKKSGGKDTSVFIHPSRRGVQRPDLKAMKVHYNTWQFNSVNPNYFTPNSENERYSRLTNPISQDNSPNWPITKEEIRQPNNRSSMISLATLPELLPGQSVQIVFAVVCARKKEDGLPNTADTDIQKENLANNAFWAQTTFNGEDRNFNGALDDGEDNNGDGILTRFTLPAPPATPITRVETKANEATLYWADNAEQSIDPISKRKDFLGYRIYISKQGFDLANVQDVAGSLQLYRGFDKQGTSAKAPYLNSLPARSTFRFDGDTNTYHYKYTIAGLASGWQQAIALTAYDSGNAETRLPSLETAQLDNIFRVFPGTSANGDLTANQPFAYPNPYYAAAVWEGGTTRPEEKKLLFANLPKRCKVKIFTQAGDFVDGFEHNGSTYRGEDSQWFTTFSDLSKNVFSGGEHAWDLLSRNSQIISRGVYVFAVEDLDSKKTFKGKFTVIK